MMSMSRSNYWMILLLMLDVSISIPTFPTSKVALERKSNKLYKPVVIIHGIFDHRMSLHGLMDRIAQRHQGTEVTIIDKLHGWRSIAPLWYQIKVFKSIIKPIMEENPRGINIIGYSQGGLVARGLIESLNKHNIHTFISLSSPQGGQYGDQFLRVFLPGYVKETAWKFFYRGPGQLLSVGNYWRDPHHIEAFQNHSIFLPRIDNEVYTNSSKQYKRNFLKLKKLVLIGGPDDGIISPWESSQFGCYDETEVLIEMEEREIYKKDLFGLQSLDKAGKVIKLTLPGIKHLDWHQNLTFIDEYIIPHLD